MDRLTAELLTNTITDVYGSLLVRYVAAMIDPSSKKKLEQWWNETTGVDLHTKKNIHHMTIKYDPSPEEFDAADIGKKLKLQVIGWAADDKGQAVVVKGYKLSHQIPHITMAVNGVEPVYSNTLLSRGYKKVKGPVISARIGWVDWKGNESFDKPIRTS